MPISPGREAEPREEDRPVHAQVTDQYLSVTLQDGRIICTPTKWYLTLTHATPEQRANYELMIDGIHWPDLDEDLSVDGMPHGRRPRWPRSVEEWRAHLQELEAWRESQQETASETGDTMTVKEVAETFGVSRYTVHSAIRRKSLPARKSGSTWLIRRQDAEARWAQRASRQ